jgi:hypothetical protein
VLRRLIGTALLWGHLSLVLWVCIRTTILLVADGQSSLPRWAQESAKRVEVMVATAHARSARALAFLDEFSATYQHAAGIDRGYGFFAPAVPSASKLVFEIFYSDGHAEYELPVVSDETAGVRISSFLFQLSDIRYDPLRELIMRMLAYGVWQRHPAAQKIRAVVGFVRVSPPGKWRSENAADYQFQYAYDFTFAQD